MSIIAAGADQKQIGPAAEKLHTQVARLFFLFLSVHIFIHSMLIFVSFCLHDRRSNGWREGEEDNESALLRGRYMVVVIIGIRSLTGGQKVFIIVDFSYKYSFLRVGDKNPW